MQGLMQDAPLLVSALLEHAEREHGDQEIVSRRGDGQLARQTYRQFAARARRVATALMDLGIHDSARVGTLAWNSDRHMELYYAVSGIGGVCHTINPRLFDDQIAFIVNDAQDKVLCVDLDLAPLVERCARQFTTVEAVVVLCRPEELPALALPPGMALHAYETLIGQSAELPHWPRLDERDAAMLCYTSGTTGMPKGVLYSHRSILLHTYGACMPDAFGASAMDCVLPAVPMFHVMAWSFPYIAAAIGYKLVLPGARLDGASMHELIVGEGVTIAAGVPTLWLGLDRHLKATGAGLGRLQKIVVGGAALPVSLVEIFRRDHGVRLQHAWGMTESSPLAGVNSPKSSSPLWPSPAYDASQRKQGRPQFGISVRTVGADGKELPRDGESVGEVQLKGYWVIDRYFNHPQLEVLNADGWFCTGDLGVIDRDGFLQITDRAKDAVKSGGEWISTQDLENLALAHPAVLDAAAIARPDPVWDERPMLLCVLKPGMSVTEAELRDHYQGKVAKFWIPDAVVFVADLPRSATGKLNKVALRQQYAGKA